MKDLGHAMKTIFLLSPRYYLFTIYCWGTFRMMLSANKHKSRPDRIVLLEC